MNFSRANVLAQVMEGRALAVIRSVRRKNGLEVWRRLHAEYDPDSGLRHGAVLSGIFSPSWHEEEGFLEQIANWETEAQSGERLLSSIKVSVLLRYSPGSIKHAFEIACPGHRNVVRASEGSHCILPVDPCMVAERWAPGTTATA